MFSCRAINEIRVNEFYKLEQSLLTNNLSAAWSLFISSNIDMKLGAHHLIFRGGGMEVGVG